MASGTERAYGGRAAALAHLNLLQVRPRISIRRPYVGLAWRRMVQPAVCLGACCAMPGADTARAMQCPPRD
eukprot:2795191-Rhodomonas_salina.5